MSSFFYNRGMTKQESALIEAFGRLDKKIKHHYGFSPYPTSEYLNRMLALQDQGIEHIEGWLDTYKILLTARHKNNNRKHEEHKAMANWKDVNFVNKLAKDVDSHQDPLYKLYEVLGYITKHEDEQIVTSNMLPELEKKNKAPIIILVVSIIILAVTLFVYFNGRQM